MKRLLKICLAVILTIVIAFGGYVFYLYASYNRIEDMQPLEIISADCESLAAGKPLRAVTWNLGFGAYSADFSFFMDGGKESRARSAQAVRENIGCAVDVLKSLDADLVLLQEVDLDATRSYHIDETAMLVDSLPGMDAAIAQNFDSAYLIVPLLEPHGASKSGIMTLSSASIDSALRRSLPVETGFMKFVDLDRCYSVSRIPADNGKTLCLYNFHLSAYTSDGTIATTQFGLMLKDMAAEYAAGNYVIAGGDFNKDLGNATETFGISGENCNWAQPLPKELIPEGLLLADTSATDSPIPSCRNADIPYTPGKSFVLTVDGFIVSDNVEILSACVCDEQFACSDHNPVVLDFILTA